MFFIRDGIKFPDMVHALKPNPKTHIQEGWRIMDFFSHIPESMHMVRCSAHCRRHQLPLADHHLACITCAAPDSAAWRSGNLALPVFASRQRVH